MHEEWESKKLKELGEIVSGGTPDTTTDKYWDDSIVWITPADLSKLSGRIINDSKRKISKLGLAFSSAILIPKNNIVVSSRAPIGYIAVSTVDFATNQGCKSIKLFDDQDPDFHYYNLLQNVDEIKKFGEGTTFAEISKKYFENVTIKVPKSLATQQKIASILSTLDGVIARTEVIIAKYTALKAGLLQDLLTRGIDETGQLRPSPQEAPDRYKESKLGLIPKEWEVKRIEDICDYVDYRGKTPPKTESGVFLVTARNIKFGFIDYETSKEYIPKYAFESTMSRGKAEIGDIVITTEAPMGNVAQIDREDIALAQRVIKYRGIRGLAKNDFLKTYFLSEVFQKQLEAESTGSTVKGIKGSRLHKLFTLIPSFSEQSEIAHRLQEVDSNIQTEQTYLTKLQGIRSGLMTDLLSGNLDLSTITL